MGTPSFSPEQQTKIQELIDAAYTKAYAKAKVEGKGEMDALKAQMEAAGKGNGKADKSGEDLSALRERLAAMEQKVQATQERERRAMLRSYAAEAGAYAAEQVSLLLAPRVRLDEEGNLFALTPSGETAYGPDGRPLSVRVLVKEFLDDNPHLVKPTH